MHTEMGKRERDQERKRKEWRSARFENKICLKDVVCDTIRLWQYLFTPESREEKNK